MEKLKVASPKKPKKLNSKVKEKLVELAAVCHDADADVEAKIPLQQDRRTRRQA